MYAHAIAFYLKLSTNFYVMLSTVRIIELNFMRAIESSSTSSSSSRFKPLETFYQCLFEFLIKSRATGCPNWDDRALVDDPASFQPHFVKQVTIRKFSLAIYIHLVKLCYSSSTSPPSLVAELKKLADRYLPHLRACFDKGRDQPGF